MELKYHIPVMMKEVLTYLNLGNAKTVVDATIGTGGHAEKILESLDKKSRFIGIDRDQETLQTAKDRLQAYSDMSQFVYGNFSEIKNILQGLNIFRIDAILFDLGISSVQLNDATRGFSFQNEGPLDMRMDRNSYISAYDLINNLNEDELSDLLWNFGQERWHNRIARFLVREREKQAISTTAQLSRLVLKALPYKHKYSNIHPATRTFQAVRIAVNRELEALQAVLSDAIDLLNKNGRICVISFHSLEDRIVKTIFKEFAANEKIRILTPKPLTPTDEEIRLNLRSRSAKLRVAERLNN